MKKVYENGSFMGMGEVEENTSTHYVMWVNCRRVWYSKREFNFEELGDRFNLTQKSLFV